MDIDRPIAIVLFALSLYGCGPDADTLARYAQRADAGVAGGARGERAPLGCARVAAAACRFLVPGPGDTAAVAYEQWPRCVPLHGFTPNEHGNHGIGMRHDFAYWVNDPLQVPAARRLPNWTFTAR